MTEANLLVEVPPTSPEEFVDLETVLEFQRIAPCFVRPRGKFLEVLERGADRKSARVQLAGGDTPELRGEPPRTYPDSMSGSEATSPL